MKKIVITIVGGAVQFVVADPDLEGYEVEVHDYDTDGIDSKVLDKDSVGQEFRRTTMPLE